MAQVAYSLSFPIDSLFLLSWRMTAHVIRVSIGYPWSTNYNRVQPGCSRVSISTDPWAEMCSIPLPNRVGYPWVSRSMDKIAILSSVPDHGDTNQRICHHWRFSLKRALHWRVPGSECPPEPQDGEVIVFMQHLDRGFSPPGS